MAKAATIAICLGLIIWCIILYGVHATVTTFHHHATTSSQPAR